MTEREKNNIVATELFGENHHLKEEVLDNLLVDWDKAYTCIFYNKRSAFFEKKGEHVNVGIRKRNEEYLVEFKQKLLKLNEIA